jgi:hypothetical protein
MLGVLWGDTTKDFIYMIKLQNSKMVNLRDIPIILLFNSKSKGKLQGIAA